MHIHSGGVPYLQGGPQFYGQGVPISMTPTSDNVTTNNSHAVLQKDTKNSRSIHCKKRGVSKHPRGEIFYVSMVTYTVTTETVKYCLPGVFSYTTFFTVYNHPVI